MERELLTLSDDEQALLDSEGNVVYVARTDESGETYYTQPAQIDAGGRICVGWEPQEVCIRWGKDDQGNKVCVSISSKKICVEWQTT